jgi:hypothetical protein
MAVAGDSVSGDDSQPMSGLDHLLAWLARTRQPPDAARPDVIADGAAR